MHTYINAVYKYGHLYDRETGKRILLRESVELALIIESRQSDLYTVDPKNDPNDEGNKPKSVEELHTQVISEGFDKVLKLKDRGDYLYFVIKAGDKNEQGRKPYECCFRVQLLEELYMVWKSPTDTDGDFYLSKDRSRSCSCVVDQLEYGELDPNCFEPIYGSSLSDVYTLTYEMYFARYGRSGPNIYRHLLFRPDQSGQPFMQARKRKLGMTTLFPTETA